MPDAERSRAARAASEAALVRVVHHSGGRPEFVVLGGLVPEMLCSGSASRHAGTTDVAVQVDLELPAEPSSPLGSRLRSRTPSSSPTTSGFGVGRPEARRRDRREVRASHRPRWSAERSNGQFDACERLGAVNLRSTGFASRDVEVRALTARVGGVLVTAEVNVTGLAGFLLAKAAAAKGRRKPKDWYDIAFVLLHNDRGGPAEAAEAVQTAFAPDLVGAVRTSLDDLLANFRAPSNQGPAAYAEQMHINHPDSTPSRCCRRSARRRRVPPTVVGAS